MTGLPSNPHRALAIAMVITLFGIGGLGLALMWAFVPGTPASIIEVPFEEQLLAIGIGTLFAAISLIPLLLLLQTPYLRGTRRFFAQLMADYRVQPWQIWALSFCAGVGEELLFRGFVQHFLGVWITALLFVVLHGYLNPLNRPLFVYGLLLCVVSAGFGWLTQLFNLPAAMAAHFWIDVVLLYYLNRFRNTVA